MVNNEYIQKKFGKFEEIKISNSSHIYKARYNDTLQNVALKIVKIDSVTPIPSYQTNIIHDYIVKCYEIIDFTNIDFKFVCFVLEWIDGISLRELLMNGKTTFDVLFLTKILHGLKYLHKRNIYHGDLKPENILLQKNNKTLIPRLIDYDSKMVDDNALYLAPGYAPPEYKNGVSVQNDLWAFGCILFEILVHKKAFMINDKEDLLKECFKFGLDRLINVKEPFRFICFKCLRFNVAERFVSVDEIINILENKNRFKLKFKMLKDYYLYN